MNPISKMGVAHKYRGARWLLGIFFKSFPEQVLLLHLSNPIDEIEIKTRCMLN